MGISIFLEPVLIQYSESFSSLLCHFGVRLIFRNPPPFQNPAALTGWVVADGPRGEQDDKTTTLRGVGGGPGRRRGFPPTRSHRYVQERCLVRTPREAAESEHSRVTGFSVFLQSAIPGVYVGFSFLARAKGRGGERERRRS